ncbi:MAG: Uma2 family endonuclease, partial [Armatimonadetes bacterium]|nr:Uma2 family endonuclease [Armatimonadota bacterium]
YGVEEFYFYDPDKGDLMGWVRKGERLVAVEKMEGWVSPRLGIMFTLKGNDLVVYYPDGEPFVIYEELREQWLKEKQRAEQERQRAERERQRAERLAQKLRELGIEPEE